MTFKFFLLAAIVAVARAGVVPPVAVVHSASVDTQYDPNPQYTFEYGVQDPFTGDSKNQVESRNGDIVRGQYSLNDPDGTRRTVDYTADPINGFNAVVSKTPLVHNVAPTPVVAKLATPVVASAPVVQHTSVVESSPVVARVPNPVTYSDLSAPVTYSRVAAAPSVAYSGVSAPVSVGVPVAHQHPRLVSPVSYSSVTAPLQYSAPVQYTAPVSAYAANAAHYHNLLQVPSVYSHYY